MYNEMLNFKKFIILENLQLLGDKIGNLLKDLQELQENYKDIGMTTTCNTIETIIFSFVVQQNNFREMEAFVLMIDDLFKDSKIKTVIQLQKVVQWPSISDERYVQMKIWEPTNPEYSDFVKELAKIKNYKNILHNLNEHNEQNLI